MDVEDYDVGGKGPGVVKYDGISDIQTERGFNCFDKDEYRLFAGNSCLELVTTFVFKDSCQIRVWNN